MTRSQKDQGLIIRKKKLLNGQVLVTILSEQSGKLTLSAFGITKITSKRLSHFEIGNYISFTYTRKGDYLTLGETDLKYAHSGIKEDSERLNTMYRIFFVLNKILPEDEPQEEVLHETLSFFRTLNKEEISNLDQRAYFNKVILYGGFIDDATANAPQFDVVLFIEGLVGEKFVWD